jgi:1-acyl-sn-glycerol-3-phosphate acyltransferase
LFTSLDSVIIASLTYLRSSVSICGFIFLLQVRFMVEPPATSPPLPPRLQALWHEAVSLTSMALLTLGFSLRIVGRHNMPQTGSALVIANHQSFFDPVLCSLASRRQLVPLARKTLFRNRFFAALIRSLNAVPIDQDGVGKEGIRTIAEQIRLGRAVCVFPEGNRCDDGAMQPFRPGIHLLLKKAPAPIVPMGIAGAFDAWPRSRKFPIPSPLCFPASRRTIAVAVGEPLDSRRYAELPRDVAMQELFDKVQDMQRFAEKSRRK